MPVQLTYKELLNDNCKWLGCKFNTSGSCASETSLMKRSIYSLDIEFANYTITCDNAMARDFNTCLLTGNLVHGKILRDIK